MFLLVQVQVAQEPSIANVQAVLQSVLLHTVQRWHLIRSLQITI